MPQTKVSDTALLRKAFHFAGFRPYPGQQPSTIYNDKRKSGIRRLKVTQGDGTFHAPQFAQEALEHHIKSLFGDRYLFGQFIANSFYRYTDDKAFVIYLAD